MTNTNFDIPIFAKSYELYKVLNLYKNSIDKQERYSLWLKCQNTTLDIIEGLLLTAQMNNAEHRITALKKVSVKIDILRIFIRLADETKIIEKKKYLLLQKMIDEIGKMLGGWLKSLQNK